MKLITQNVKCFPPMEQGHVLHDIHLTGSQGALIGWQEINLPRYRSAINSLPPKFDHVFGPDDNAQTISYNGRTWDQVDHGSELLHDGEAGFTPNQYINWVMLKNKKTGAAFVLNNVHYVPGAWPPSENNTQDHRREMWNKGNAVHKALIRSWVAAGYAVAGTGDFNRRDYPVVGEKYGRYKVRYLTPDSSIDKIWVVGSNKFSWHVTKTERLTGRFSDHQGWRANIYLRSR